MNNLMMLMGNNQHGLYDLSTLASSYSDTGAGTTTYTVTMTIQTDQSIDITKAVNSDLLNEQDPYTEDTGQCWVRLAYVSGDALMTGPTLNTWFACTSARAWVYSYLSSGGVDLKSGVYALSLASDAAGSTIEAGPVNITFEVGETA